MAKTLRQYREEFGWSQAELSRQAGIDAATVRKVESGKPISGRSANQICQALGKKTYSTVHFKDITDLKVKV
jgi:transcriptional regulator with XRE-family HTH domain